jgi:PAT family beta-lactamase induction signal transducer AmpG
MPVFLVQDVSKTIFQAFGIENQVIATWTALIALPWSFKLLWGPIVELNGTKRRWITGAQLGIAVLIVLAALALQLPNFFGITLSVLAVTAVFSATCDIATDGYYLLTTQRSEQGKWVGWQSAMFRLGRLFATGGIVYFAGVLMNNGLSKELSWMIALFGLAAVYGAGALYNHFMLPRPAEDAPRAVPQEENRLNLARAALVIAAFGFIYMGLAFFFGIVGHVISGIPLFAKWKLPETADMILFWITLWSGPSLVVHLLQTLVGWTVGGVLGWFALGTLRGTEMGRAFGTFFGQKDLWRILLFVMFYRFGEAMLGSIVPLFLMDTRKDGADPTQGLGLAVDQVGLVNGTWGVLGIVLGGIIGGWFISRIGIKNSFWILAAAMNVPNLLYLWAAGAFPGWQVMSVITFVDQFGYGFGFAGYLICLQAIAQRNPSFTTAHYAIGTGLGALLIVAAGTLSGALMASVDFPVIFVVVLFMAIPCLLTIRLIPSVETQGIAVANTDMAD